MAESKVTEATREVINEAGDVLVALEEKSLEIEFTTRGVSMNVDDSRRYFGSTLHQARVATLANLYVNLSRQQGRKNKE